MRGRVGKIAVVILAAAVLAATAVGIGMGIHRMNRDKLITARGPVNVVVFGDSIWAISRDETGIAAVLEEEMKQAKVYNCAVMGTTASVRVPENSPETPLEELEAWNAKSLTAILSDWEQQEAMLLENGVEEIPKLEEADYFVLAYGLNDYFCAVPRDAEDPYNVNSYAGALRNAVKVLQERNPQAKVLILSQTYCQGYSYGKVDSESDYRDYGGGTGPDYVAAAEKAAEDMGCIFVNNYEEMGIHLHNGPKYLSDATHLTPYGREKYAKILSRHLLKEYAQWQ